MSTPHNKNYYILLFVWPPLFLMTASSLGMKCKSWQHLTTSNFLYFSTMTSFREWCLTYLYRVLQKCSIGFTSSTCLSTESLSLWSFQKSSRGFRCGFRSLLSCKKAQQPRARSDGSILVFSEKLYISRLMIPSMKCTSQQHLCSLT